jgi:redox-sensing transcriptional repressor
MKEKIPVPTVSRLCKVYRLCTDLEAQGVEEISSTRIGEILGVSSHSIRKDINYLGEVGNTGSGYDVGRLRTHIGSRLGLMHGCKACIVGLGRLGTAIMEYERLATSGYDVVAGFDSNINRLETIRTRVKLYPAYEITDVVSRESIDLAVLAVPAQAAQECAVALVKGGIKAILNFAPVAIKTGNPSIVVRNIDMVNELRTVSALRALTRREGTARTVRDNKGITP